jgi:hypothetical protein
VSVYFGVEAADFFQQTVALLQHFNNFERKSHCRADCLVCYSAHSTHRGLAMSIASLTPTEQTTAIKRLAGDAIRSLTGWCRETRQPVDLQLYVDDATMARIWSNVLRFQCPRCGTKHETEVQRLASKPLSVETPQTKRTRHQQTAIASPR